jgi:tetratricopeptide (TPR) repeat protein
MSKKEIKDLLIQTKDHIDKKEFKESIIICETILKKDSKNNNALLFIGYSLQKLGQYEKSEKAYLKLNEISQDNIQTLKGLQELYIEK